MEHEEVLRQKMTEKYLLDELGPDQRDQFEEHVFDCQECALDVRTAAMFVEQSKVVLSEEPAAASVRIPVPVAANQGWFAWLRPAFAVPVMAALLAVVGYQNFVTYPQLRALNQPQLLPATLVSVRTRSAVTPMVTVKPGSGFLLAVRIPPASNYTSYTADLLNPAGKLEWSLAIPASSTEDTYNLQVPAANRDPGIYTIKIHGVNAAGQISEVGFPAPFEVQVQK